MPRTLVSICMITAQTDCPLLYRKESVYDVLQSSVCHQNYSGPIEVIVADTDIERIRREWQTREWNRVERVVLTSQVRHDRIAIAGARNTAAVYARGDLIIFVDDCTELLPNFVTAAVELYDSGYIPNAYVVQIGEVIHVDHTWRNQGCPTDRQVWFRKGQTPGVFVVPRGLFLALNGFDENFDGNWGCEDCEFWTRLDRLNVTRACRPDLGAIRWAHGATPGRVRIRRCRELYAQWAYRKMRVAANQRLSESDLDELRSAPPCAEHCELCHADDRDEQIETYRMFPAEFDLRALHEDYSRRPSGTYFDPWR